MKTDTTFPSKFIINDFKEAQVVSFLKGFIKYAWQDHDVPEGHRMVKESKKLSLEMLPKDFNIDDIAKRAFKKGIMHFDKIGVVNVWISLVITKTAGTNPAYKIEIDKYSYEKDGHSIKSIVEQALAEI